ncbi:MAG: GNAT family N-acetyltransferase [Bradyrhizobiaceae bacterium]|nr:MAG: GNAT family N-acetyltransferase [Bradyrhizobiaceae bacterium]
MLSLPWRAEAAFLKAWPALTTVVYDDWQARLAGGLSRRANSVNPLTANAVLTDTGLGFFEHVFRNQNLPLIVRVPTLLGGDPDAALDRSGFTREGDCLVLHSALEAIATQSESAVTIADEASRAWFDAIHAAQDRPAVQRATYEVMIGAIALPSGFAMLCENDEPVALAYVAIDGDLMCLESVVTAASHRGKGYARRLTIALLHWAKAKGAAQVCLQVEATNNPALTLYRKLGIGQELYRYHYRRQHGALRTGDA